MADSAKASVPEVKAFFAADGGDPLTAKDLIALKKSAGVAYPTAYDDLAYGIGDGTLSY